MRFITILNGKVSSIRDANTIVDGEVQSDEGNIGQIIQYDEEGIIIGFIDDVEAKHCAAVEVQKNGLLKEIDIYTIFGNNTEVDRCKQEYIDLCDGKPVTTKADIESELADAVNDADNYLGMIMESEGVW